MFVLYTWGLPIIGLPDRIFTICPIIRISVVVFFLNTFEMEKGEHTQFNIIQRP